MNKATKYALMQIRLCDRAYLRPHADLLDKAMRDAELETRNVFNRMRCLCAYHWGERGDTITCSYGVKLGGNACMQRTCPLLAKLKGKVKK